MRQINPRRGYRERRFRIRHYRKLVAGLVADLQQARRERDRLIDDPAELVEEFIQRMMDEERPN